MRQVSKSQVREFAREITTAPGVFDCQVLLEYGFCEARLFGESKRAEYPASCPCLVQANGVGPADGLYDLLDAEEQLANAFESFLLAGAGQEEEYTLPQIGQAGVFHYGKWVVWYRFTDDATDLHHKAARDVYALLAGRIQ